MSTIKGNTFVPAGEGKPLEDIGSVMTIAREMAEVEFNRFAEAMDLDVDTATMNAEDLEGYEQQVGRVIRAIQKGSLVINDNGEPVFTTQRGEAQRVITFYEPTGASLMAMDKKKKSEDIGKMFSTMADMTKSSDKWFAQMKHPDLKVCLAVTTLFLG